MSDIDRERNGEQSERDARVQEHADQADAAIEQAQQSIREIRREMGFPFARSTRLEDEREPAGMD